MNRNGLGAQIQDRPTVRCVSFMRRCQPTFQSDGHEPVQPKPVTERAKPFVDHRFVDT